MLVTLGDHRKMLGTPVQNTPLLSSSSFLLLIVPPPSRFFLFLDKFAALTRTQDSREEKDNSMNLLNTFENAESTSRASQLVSIHASISYVSSLQCALQTIVVESLTPTQTDLICLEK